jgi:phage terminase large subunit-like protein
LPLEKLKSLRETAGDQDILEFIRCWTTFARGQQLPPAGDWRTWLILAGRGFGKTRTGAEWVRDQVKDGVMRIALIAPTFADARDIMVGGESGLLAVCWEGDETRLGALTGRPVFETTKRRVVWKNGAEAMLFSAEEPERLRGPQHETIWADELAAWRHPGATWDMAMFGLRLGTRPRACVTTTPKPLELIRELVADPATALTRGSTFDNENNLAPGFIEAVRARYDKTNLGRQELHAEILKDTEGAMWKHADFDMRRRATPDGLRRIVVAVDPPAGSKATSDACGIVAAGLDADGVAHVIADATVRAAKPSEWAARAVALYETLGADLIVAEVNQGGDMVEAVIRQVDPKVALKKTHAGRKKWLRAEPVSALYQQNRVMHAPGLNELEDEMCAFTPDGLPSRRSPDRLDALVWALSELLLVRQSVPRVRGL